MRWSAAWLAVCVLLVGSVFVDVLVLDLFVSVVVVLVTAVGSVTVYRWCAERDRRRRIGTYTFPIPGGTITVFGRLTEAQAAELALRAREMWDAR
jgi:hypothetical protein